MFNLLGSHDTARILTASNNDKSLAKLQFMMLFSMPGSPCIYYGDEIGMAGENDPGCRACMEWEPSKQDREMLDFMKRLIQLRTKHEAFGSRGELQFIASQSDDILLYSKKNIIRRSCCLLLTVRRRRGRLLYLQHLNETSSLKKK